VARDLTEPQAGTLLKLESGRWTTIGTDDFPRPTITVLARSGLVELADKLKRVVDPTTAGWAAQFARPTREGERLKPALAKAARLAALRAPRR